MKILSKTGDEILLLAVTNDFANKGDYFVIEDFNNNKKLLVQFYDEEYFSSSSLVEEIIKDEVISKFSTENIFDPLEITNLSQTIRDVRIFKTKIRASIDNDNQISTDVDWVPSRVNSKIVKISLNEIKALLKKNMRYPISLGRCGSDNQNFEIFAEDLDGKLNIITGKKETGKSHLSKILINSLIQYGAYVIVFDLNVLKRGFYPRGQGLVEIRIRKATHLHTIEFCNFKEVEPNIISIAGRLPKHIPERQIGSAIATLEKKGIRYFKHKSILENAESPGSSILVYSTSESGIYLGADSIGEKNVQAEIIGSRAAKKFIDDYEFHACVDQHLADMLVLPLSFVKGKSKYKISRITTHLLTNLEVIRMLNSIEYHFEKISENEFVLSIEGNPVI